jgi:tyrosinase
MRAQESLVLSLLSTAAVALPSTTGKSCKAHKHVSQSNDHIAELRAQASSLRAELSSVYAAPSQACRPHSAGTVHGTVPTAGFTAAFTAAMSSGAPTATAPAAYETFFSKAGPISRLTPTSAASEDAPAPSGYGNGMDSYGSASSGAVSGAVSSGAASGASSGAASGAASSEAPFPTFSTHANGTTVNHAATGAFSSASSAFTSGASGAVSSTASLSSSASSTASSSSSSSTGVSPTYVPKMSDFSVEEFKSGEAFKKVSAIADQRMKARELEGGCTYENAAVRTEFRAMSNEMRKQFTDSITCLKNMPPKASAEELTSYAGASGANHGILSRYDEYVATHIENTFKIHATADFLAWHRHFIFEFESDLKNSCGYTGTLPYWDWSVDAEAVDQSEIFNGDEYSMGSNGEFIAGRSDTYLGLQDINFPPGTGGGCVYSGPFSNTTYTTNLGPIDSPYNNNVKNEFDANPRCLVRDLNSYFSKAYLRPEKVADLVIGEDSVQYFQALMQGYLGDNKLGVHGGGHWVGGGPSQLEDFHSSPNDPVFYIHHAMIDRIWTVWQYMDREARQNQIYGTSTLNNSPASADMTLQDSLPFGLVAQSPVLGDLMDTLAGPYCYRYE